jgi:ketosteroid isomerase-like protein
MTDHRISEIEEAEAMRGRALVSRDWVALAALLSEDLVHIHATGLIDDKTAYLEGVKTKLDFLKVERVSLDARVHGDWAIATGVLNQAVRIKGPETEVEFKAATTQVWIRSNGRWMLSTFQATRIG